MLLYMSWKIYMFVIHLKTHKTTLTVGQSPLSFWTLLRTESFAGSTKSHTISTITYCTCPTPA